METNSYDEVLKSAFDKYSHNNNYSEHDAEHLHKCIAFTIDELDISSIDKLLLFSQCVINLESTLERMERLAGIEQSIQIEWPHGRPCAAWVHGRTAERENSK